MSSYLILFALTLYLEAANQGIHGMEMVADVINNRVHAAEYMKDRSLPLRYRSIILKPEQFSCWNNLDPDETYLIPVQDFDVYLEAFDIAREHVSLLKDVEANPIHYTTVGENKDILKLRRYPFKYTSADHYHTKDVLPTWSTQMVKVAEYKDHVFYKSH